jgi:excisionase family DNA binding protein
MKANSQPIQKIDVESGRAVREFWSLTEVAERLGVHVFTVRRLCWHRKLRATRIGSAVRVSEAELQRYITANTESPGPNPAEANPDVASPR